MSENEFEQSVAEAMKAIGFQHFVTEYQKSLAARNAVNEQLVLKLAGTKSALKRAQLTPTVLGKIVLFNLLVSGNTTQLDLSSEEFYDFCRGEDSKEIENLSLKIVDIVDPESRFLVLAASALANSRTPSEYKTLFSSDEMLVWAKPSKSTRKPKKSVSMRKAPTQRPKNKSATDPIEESSSDQGDESVPSSSSTESQPLSGLESTSSSPTPTLPLESASSKSAILDDSSTSHLSEDPIASENYSDLTFPKVCQEIEQLQTKLSDLETFRVDIKTLRSDCDDLRSRIGSGFQSIGKNSQIKRLIHSSALRKQYGWDSGQQSVTHLRRQLESEKRILITFENTCRDYNDHITDLKRLGLTDSIEPLPLDFSNIEKLQLSLQRQLETLSSLVDRSKELEASFRALKDSIERTQIGDSDLIKEVDKFCSKQLKKSNLMATVIGNRILARNRPASDTQSPIGIPLPLLGALFQNGTDGKQIHKILNYLLESKSIELNDNSSLLRIAQYWSEDFFREHCSDLPPAFISDIFPFIIAKGLYDKNTDLLYLATEIGQKAANHKIVRLATALRNAIHKDQLEEITSSLDSPSAIDSQPKESEILESLKFLLSTKSGKLGGFYYELLELLASEFRPLLQAIEGNDPSKVKTFIQISPEEVLKSALSTANKKLKKNNRYPSWALSNKVKPAFNLARQWLRLTRSSKSADPQIQNICSEISELNLTEAFTVPAEFIKTWFEHLEWFLHCELPGKRPVNCRHLHLSTTYASSDYRLYLATDLLCDLWNPLLPVDILDWYYSNNDFHSVELSIEQLFEDKDDKFGLVSSLDNKLRKFKEPFLNDPLCIEASKFRDQYEDINISLQFLEESLDDYDIESAGFALEQIGQVLDDYRRTSNPALNYSPRFLRESGVDYRSDTTKEERDKIELELKRTKFKDARAHCSVIEAVIEVYLDQEKDQSKSNLLKACLFQIDLPSVYPSAIESKRYSKLLEPLLDYVPTSLELAEVLNKLLIECFTANKPARKQEADQLLRDLHSSQKRQQLDTQIEACVAWLFDTLPKNGPQTVSQANLGQPNRGTSAQADKRNPETSPKPKLEPESRQTEEKDFKTQIKKADQFREDIQLLDLAPTSAAPNDETAHLNDFKAGDDVWQQTKLLLRKRTVDWGRVHQFLIDKIQLQFGKPLSETESLFILAGVRVFSTDPDKPLQDKIDANEILLNVLAINPPITLIGPDVYASLLKSCVKECLTEELNNEAINHISFDRWIEDQHSAIFASGSKLFELDDDFSRRSKLRAIEEDYSNFPESLLVILYNSLSSGTPYTDLLKTRSRILTRLFRKKAFSSITYLLRPLKEIGKELGRVIQSLDTPHYDSVQRDAVNTQIHAINQRHSKERIPGLKPFLDFLKGVQEDLTSTITTEGVLNIQEHEVDLEIDDSPYLSVNFWITNDSDDWFDQAIITVEETEDSFGTIEAFNRNHASEATELGSNQAFLFNSESGNLGVGPGSRETVRMKIAVREDHAEFYRIPYSITYRSTKGHEKVIDGILTYRVTEGFVDKPTELWLDKHYEGRSGNPVPKTAFYGRDVIQQKLLSVIEKNGSAVIHGARRVGKTSLIDVIKENYCNPQTGYQEPDLARPFILKVIMSRPDTDVNGPQPMAADLIYRIIEAIDGEPDLMAQINDSASPQRDIIAHWKKTLTKDVKLGSSVARSILKIFDYLKDQGILRRMAIFIDEAQALCNATDSKRTFGFLRDEIMHNRNVPISFIFVGSGALKFISDKEDHPLYGSVEVAELKGFEKKENEACDQTFLPIAIRGKFLANDGSHDDELVLAKARELTGRVPLFLSLLGAATAKQWGIRRINQALVEDTAERLAQGEIDLGKGPSIFYAYQESGLANHIAHIHHLAKYLWYLIAEKTTLSKRKLNYKVLQKDPDYRRIYDHPIVNYALFDQAVEALIAENLIEENTDEGVRYLSMKAPLTHLALKKEDVLGKRKDKAWRNLIEALDNLETSTDSK